MPRITLPDGSVRQYDEPVTARRIAESIGPGLVKAAVGVKVNGELADLDRPIDRDAAIAIVTKPRKGTPVNEQDPEALYLVRHSAAHVMAEAIQRLWPDAQLAYGPPVDNGFYYDIALDEHISSDDFERIEREMAKIVEEDRPFIRYELSLKRGFDKLKEEGNKYKEDNARRAEKSGSKCLSWYMTGRPASLKDPDTSQLLYRVEGVGPVISDQLIGNLLSVTDGAVRAPKHIERVSAGDEKKWGDRHLVWEDLCMGPHVPSTGYIGAYKIMSVAQSHWHGDVHSDKFQRIYGTAFYHPADLEAYLRQLEEAKQRDHRIVGQKLGLFTIDEQVGPGLVLWKPRGAMVRTILQEFLQKELLGRGYQIVYTPHIGKIDLYKTSGHYPYYADSQFPPIQLHDESGEGEQYLLRAMNCPHHIKVFASEPHSYRDLPVRLAEFGTVYRFEQSGELTGMTRVRGLTQDDAHIFCTAEQVRHEVSATVGLTRFVLNTFGFEDVEVYLSLRDPDTPDKYTGDPATWDRAERELRQVLQESGLGFSEQPGEANFYGPKIDFNVRDVIGRKWQLGTVQLDYNLPERFGLEYIGPDNRPHRPVMIHRAPFGSMERFMAILIEHFHGAFPLWLAPEQVRILPVSEKFSAYGDKVHNALIGAGLRAQIDASAERVQAKIRSAQEMKVPYMLIVGGRDESAGTVSVRDRARGDLGALTVEQFLERARLEVESRGQKIITV